MADLPALFSGPMVGALLDDLKTQTRRANHLERLRRFGPISEFGRSNTSGYDWHFRDKEKRWHDLRHAALLAVLPYHVGDRLYVREAWRVPAQDDRIPPRDLVRQIVGYEADCGPGQVSATGKFRQAMHMPRWASRITLTVTDVRVERLQSISEADAIAEGIATGDYPVDVYASLWNTINGPGSWEANPFVAAYTFTVALGNIDQIGRAA